MDTQHADVIEQAVAYVRKVLGLPPKDETERTSTAPSTAPENASDETTGIYPREDTFKNALQLDAESARREDGE
jgi:hypothetical protein